MVIAVLLLASSLSSSSNITARTAYLSGMDFGCNVLSENVQVFFNGWNSPISLPEIFNGSCPVESLYRFGSSIDTAGLGTIKASKLRFWKVGIRRAINVLTGETDRRWYSSDNDDENGESYESDAFRYVLSTWSGMKGKVFDSNWIDDSLFVTK